MRVLQTVHVVRHAHALADGAQDVKVIGVYRFRRDAEAAVDRLRFQPGFCDHQGGFQIEEYALDQDYWTDGFTA